MSYAEEKTILLKDIPKKNQNTKDGNYVIPLGKVRPHTKMVDGKEVKLEYSAMQITPDYKKITMAPTDKLFLLSSKMGQFAFCRVDEKMKEQILSNPSFVSDDPDTQEKLKAQVDKIADKTNELCGQLDNLEVQIKGLHTDLSKVKTFVQRTAPQKNANGEEEDVPINPIYRMVLPTVNRKESKLNGQIGKCYVKSGTEITQKSIVKVLYDKNKTDAKNPIPLTFNTEQETTDGKTVEIAIPITEENLQKAVPRFSMISAIKFGILKTKKNKDIIYKLEIDGAYVKTVEYVAGSDITVKAEDGVQSDDEKLISAPKAIKYSHTEEVKVPDTGKKSNKKSKDGSDEEEEKPKKGEKKSTKKTKEESEEEEEEKPKKGSKKSAAKEESEDEEEEKPKKPAKKAAKEESDGEEEEKEKPKKPTKKAAKEESGDDEEEKPKKAEKKPAKTKSDEEEPKKAEKKTAKEESEDDEEEKPKKPTKKAAAAKEESGEEEEEKPKKSNNKKSAPKEEEDPEDDTKSVEAVAAAKKKSTEKRQTKKVVNDSDDDT